MSKPVEALSAHPLGEQSSVEVLPEAVGLCADTFGGRVHVEWDPTAAATPFGQLPFFVEFLKLGGLFDPWVADCPLTLVSPNAPAKRDILGTLLLAILAGHQRYAHITALRGDAVNAALLGMRRVMSEDSVRRALAKIDEAAGVEWLQRHLDYTFQPLLGEPWILDVDTTVKPLYGRQEGAVVGYNPHKPGRPSHTYHTYAIAELRLMLEVEVQAGNQHASKHSAPGLWALLARLGRTAWPCLLRGDCDWGGSSPQTTPPFDPRVFAELRSGGSVLFIRHGKSDPTQADVDTQNLNDCATQRNLTEEGKAQARAIGDGPRQLRVPVGRVVSSEYCRALETARLAGFTDIEMSINVSEPQNVAPVEAQRRAAALRELLATAPAPGTDTVIVSHRPNILDALGKDYFDIVEGEIVAFQPVAEASGYKMLARIPRPEMLAQAAAPH